LEQQFESPIPIPPIKLEVGVERENTTGVVDFSQIHQTCIRHAVSKLAKRTGR
jgi:hypothetical protein